LSTRSSAPPVPEATVAVVFTIAAPAVAQRVGSGIMSTTRYPDVGIGAVPSDGISPSSEEGGIGAVSEEEVVRGWDSEKSRVSWRAVALPEQPGASAAALPTRSLIRKSVRSRAAESSRDIRRG
jgi:hypothetical protein